MTRVSSRAFGSLWELRGGDAATSCSCGHARNSLVTKIYAKKAERSALSRSVKRAFGADAYPLVLPVNNSILLRSVVILHSLTVFVYKLSFEPHRVGGKSAIDRHCSRPESELKSRQTKKVQRSRLSVQLVKFLDSVTVFFAGELTGLDSLDIAGER